MCEIIVAVKSELKMAKKFDLTSKICQYLDRHLTFPLLEFLCEKEVIYHFVRLSNRERKKWKMTNILITKLYSIWSILDWGSRSIMATNSGYCQQDEFDRLHHGYSQTFAIGRWNATSKCILGVCMCGSAKLNAVFTLSIGIGRT